MPEVNKLDSLVKDLESSAIADKNGYESKLEAVREDFNKNLSKREAELENRLSELRTSYEARIETINKVIATHDKSLKKLSDK